MLAQELPASGLVLEVASGTGEHAVFFAQRFAHLRWQPSDPDIEALSSIAAWREECSGSNLLPPLALDASDPEWPIAEANAVVCINMVHISPWAATEGLLAGAGRVLAAGAPLVLYGPYREQGLPTAPSNEAFDQSLKARDPAWGLRLVEDVDAAALRCGFACTARYVMPANNLMLVYRRS